MVGERKWRCSLFATGGEDAPESQRTKAEGRWLAASDRAKKVVDQRLTHNKQMVYC